MEKIGKLVFVCACYVVFLMYYFIKALFVGNTSQQTALYADQ